MTPTEYFRRANKITEWTRLGMITQDEADRLNLVLELDRRRAVAAKSADAVRTPKAFRPAQSLALWLSVAEERCK